MNLEERLERTVVLRAASRAAEADEELRQILGIDDANWFPYFMLGVNAALDGRPEEALRIAETAYSRAPWFKPIVGLYAAMLKRAERLDRAALLIEQLQPTDGYGDPLGSAMFHLLTGDLEASADWVEKAIDQRQPAVFFFLNGHAQALRSSPRWPALMRAMNLNREPDRQAPASPSPFVSCPLL